MEKNASPVAAALAQAPDLLLLDEPTNHLDLAGIGMAWNRFCERPPIGLRRRDQPRPLLPRNVTTVMVEKLSSILRGGFLRVEGNYSNFLEAKEDYLHAASRSIREGARKSRPQ